MLPVIPGGKEDMKLYGYWRSLATCRVRIALNLKGVAFEEYPLDLMDGATSTRIAIKRSIPRRSCQALVIDDDEPLFQSIAIIEYVDRRLSRNRRCCPRSRGRARVRGLAQIIVSDTHPLIVPRVREFLEKELALDERRNKWIQKWVMKGLQAVEAQLARTPRRRASATAHPTLADICLASQVFGAQLFGFDLSSVPTVMRVFGECMKLEAFDRAQPLKQPGPREAAALESSNA